MRTFVQFLEQRLRLGTCSSEDSLRYSFFAALLRHGVKQERVILEYVHPGIKGAKIDTMIMGEDRRPIAAIEFKYDRSNPSKTTQPLPQKAGALFHDFVRLLKLRERLERYLVYVTDAELANYLSSPRNGLNPRL